MVNKPDEIVSNGVVHVDWSKLFVLVGCFEVNMTKRRTH